MNVDRKTLLDELSSHVNDMDPLPRVSVGKYVQTAESLRNKADEYRDQGNVRQQYVMQYRFVSSIIYTIPRHPAFDSHNEEYAALKKAVLEQYLPELEVLRDEFSATYLDETAKDAAKLEADVATIPAASGSPPGSKTALSTQGQAEKRVTPQDPGTDEHPSNGAMKQKPVPAKYDLLAERKSEFPVVDYSREFSTAMNSTPTDIPESPPSESDAENNSRGAWIETKDNLSTVGPSEEDAADAGVTVHKRTNRGSSGASSPPGGTPEPPGASEALN